MATRRVRTEFDANTAQFDRGVQRMNRNMRRFQRGTESRLDRLDRRFQRSARAVGRFRNAIGALVAVAGVRRLASSFDRVLTRLDDIGKASDRLGIGVEALQELRFAAEQSGIAVNTFDTAMQRFTRRVAEAASGTGSARDALQELGVQLRDSNGVLRPTEELLFDVADALADVETQGDRVRLGFKLFDSEGLKVIQMLQEGSENLRRMREEARALGIVMAEDMVRDATRMKDEMGRQFAALDSLWTQFVVNFLRGADRIFSFVPSTVEEQLAERIEELRGIQNALAAGPGVMRGPLDTGGTAGLNKRQAELLSEIRTLEELRQAQTRVNQAIAEAETAGGLAGLSGGGTGGRGGSLSAEATEERASALERELGLLAQRANEINRIVQAQARLNPEMQGYETALKAAEIEARLLARAEAEGVEVKGDLAERIRDVARAYAEAEAASEALRETQSELDQTPRIFDDMARGLEGAISQARTFEEALQNVLAVLARIATQQLSQPGGGFLGSLFRSIFRGSAAPSTSPIPVPRPVAHRGGVIGRDSFPTRNVPDFVFANAPRMHSGGIAGLRPNEVPAILEKGEIVVPKNIGLGRSTSITMGDMVVNITEPGATPEQIRRLMAEERRATIEEIIRMNDDDPGILKT